MTHVTYSTSKISIYFDVIIIFKLLNCFKNFSTLIFKFTTSAVFFIIINETVYFYCRYIFFSFDFLILVQDWDERRKKAVIRDYYKELNKSEKAIPKDTLSINDAKSTSKIKK